MVEVLTLSKADDLGSAAPGSEDFAPVFVFVLAPLPLPVLLALGGG